MALELATIHRRHPNLSDGSSEDKNVVIIKRREVEHFGKDNKKAYYDECGKRIDKLVQYVENGFAQIVQTSETFFLQCINNRSWELAGKTFLVLVTAAAMMYLAVIIFNSAKDIEDPVVADVVKGSSIGLMCASTITLFKVSDKFRMNQTTGNAKEDIAKYLISALCLTGIGLAAPLIAKFL